jgi:predicted molibdopterin-dependent oxidoreductase YjgC
MLQITLTIDGTSSRREGMLIVDAAMRCTISSLCYHPKMEPAGQVCLVEGDALRWTHD